ncbi:MAG: hypothetical protein AB7V13_30745 [Pseudorhodoplanes sp.]|uniref:hypothetical protein n=1 Tax=Pseudorhodoplanes sp. TaxID=1934341 RepID=UPI003D0D05C3
MARNLKTGVAAATAIALLLPLTALWAQTSEPAVPAQPAPPKLDPRACSDRDRLARGDVVENDGPAPQSQELLSDKLARTDGVICPPLGLDPHIRAPAPRTGSDMPVITPPASPGGAPPPK